MSKRAIPQLPTDLYTISPASPPAPPPVEPAPPPPVDVVGSLGLYTAAFNEATMSTVEHPTERFLAIPYPQQVSPDEPARAAQAISAGVLPPLPPVPVQDQLCVICAANIASLAPDMLLNLATGLAAIECADDDGLGDDGDGTATPSMDVGSEPLQTFGGNISQRLTTGELSNGVVAHVLLVLAGLHRALFADGMTEDLYRSVATTISNETFGARWTIQNAQTVFTAATTAESSIPEGMIDAFTQKAVTVVAKKGKITEKDIEKILKSIGTVITPNSLALTTTATAAAGAAATATSARRTYFLNPQDAIAEMLAARKPAVAKVALRGVQQQRTAVRATDGYRTSTLQALAVAAAAAVKQRVFTAAGCVQFFGGTASSLGRRIVRESATTWRRVENTIAGEKVDARRGPRNTAPTAVQAQRAQNRLSMMLEQTSLFADYMARRLSPQDLQATVAAAATTDLNATTASQSDIKAAAAASVLEAAAASTRHVSDYAADVAAATGATVNVETLDTSEIEAPACFNGFLKSYQLTGLRWLSSLWATGLNGILGDDMGLGKTIQTLSFLAWLSESQDIHGPFLIVSPPSTLHNWVSEAQRFVPTLKTRPYWGVQSERATIARTWGRNSLGRENSPFHILVTSYQILVRDAKVLRGVRWQYVVLDEAQAIKNNDTQRWKALLEFPCRNRLLLSGTPFQNSLKEVWSLLNFIMPALFSDLNDFLSWFGSGTASSSLKLTEEQMSRLHELLKPFMLRRVKRDVEKELGEKQEILVKLELTYVQQRMLRALSEHAHVATLLQAITARRDDTVSTASSTVPSRGVSRPGSPLPDEGMDVMALDAELDSPDQDERDEEPDPNEEFDDDVMDAVNNAKRRGRKPAKGAPSGAEATLNNLLMQARKICNHPILFRKLDFSTPISLAPLEYAAVPPYPLTTHERGESNLRVAAATRELLLPVGVRKSNCPITLPRLVDRALVWRALRPAVGGVGSRPVVEVSDDAEDDYDSAAAIASPWTETGGSVLRGLTYAPAARLAGQLRAEMTHNDFNWPIYAARAAAAAATASEYRAEQNISAGPTGAFDHIFAGSERCRGALSAFAGQPTSAAMTGARAALSQAVSVGVSAEAWTPATPVKTDIPCFTEQPPLNGGGSLRSSIRRTYAHEFGAVGVAPVINLALANRGLECFQPGARVTTPDLRVSGGISANDARRDSYTSTFAACSLGLLHLTLPPLLRREQRRMPLAPVNDRGELVPVTTNGTPQQTFESDSDDYSDDGKGKTPADDAEGSDDEGADMRFVNVYTSLTGAPTALTPIYNRMPPLQRSMSVRIWDRTSLVADSAKFKYLDKLLPALAAGRHRPLIYSQMARVLDCLGEFLTYRGFRYVRLDGSCEVQERHSLVQRFTQDQSIFAFLLTTRAGGVGINLVAADTVILFDSDPNPTWDAQAVDRAHRLGQTKPVTVYRLCTSDTVEERMLAMAEVKRNAQTRLLDAAEAYSDRLFGTGSRGQREALELLLGADNVDKRVQRERRKKGL